MKLIWPKLLPSALMAMAVIAPPSISFTPLVKPATTTSKGIVKSPFPMITFTTRSLGSATTTTSLFSSTTPSKQEQANGEISNNKQKSISQKSEQQQAAIDALQRLLSRQESELEETKRLLELYNSVNGDDDNNNNVKEENPDLLSVALAVLKGFDYGFQSRSEGPTSKILKGGDNNNNDAFVGYGPPANVLSLGSQQFMRNLNAMRNEYEDEDDVGK